MTTELTNEELEEMGFTIVGYNDLKYYRINNHVNRPNQGGWCSEVWDPTHKKIMSAPTHKCLDMIISMDWPVCGPNVCYSLEKCPIDYIDALIPKGFVEDVIQLLADVVENHLKNLKFDRILKGDNFVVAVCNSKSQAKKLLVNRNLSSLQDVRVDRNGEEIAIYQKEVPI